MVCQNLLHNPVRNASWLHFLPIVLIQVLPRSSVTIAAYMQTSHIRAVTKVPQ